MIILGLTTGEVKVTDELRRPKEWQRFPNWLISHAVLGWGSGKEVAEHDLLNYY